MKRISVAMTVLSLLLACSIPGLGQGRGKSARKASPRGNQICTGCCDPCYESDVYKIKSGEAGAATAPQARQRRSPEKPSDKGAVTPRNRNGRR